MGMKLNDPVAVAKAFAAAIHADQGQNVDGRPYVNHLESVYQVLLRHDFTDRDILAAAYLHDVVEDTGVSLEIISKLFGDPIAGLVFAVTDEPGANRKERKALTYPKIKAAGEKAVALKLADRIANVEYSYTSGNTRMAKMYKKEYADFHDSLRTIGQLRAMWLDLERTINCIE